MNESIESRFFMGCGGQNWLFFSAFNKGTKRTTETKQVVQMQSVLVKGE
ncbi:hypothetical protein [Domibacillus mangrovi]|nr:hypothetical protein [Domibacillus mangrovi]